ncbi:MAG: transposase family protein [Undibacterium sp.]|nr:transposase family protein [Undibacterium sp.]
MRVDFQQIASALCITKRSAERRALQELWVCSLETVRGGQRKVFDIKDLPSDIGRKVETHLAITAKGLAADFALKTIAKLKADDALLLKAKQVQGEENLKRLMDDLPVTVQARFDGRFEIVKSWERWLPTVQPLGKKKSYGVYVGVFNAGESDVSPLVVQKMAPISSRTLERWVAALEDQGLAGLIDKKDGKCQRDVNVITKNAHLQATTVALLIARPTITMKTLTEMLGQAARDTATGEVLFEAPNYWAVTRFCNGYKQKNAEFLLASSNPDAWKNKHMVAFGEIRADRLNERWEMDATPADWMLLDEDGNQKRYSVSVVIDVYSRRSLMVVSPTPRAETHKLALRLAIISWGVPELVVTDNGKDYVSRDFLNVLNLLAIDHHRTKPFSPWEKPYVERMNQTMLHSVLEMYSSFVGHNVAERSAIEARTSFAERLFNKDRTEKTVEIAMPAALLQLRLNQWLSGVYEQREHDGLHDMSPFAVAASYTGEVRRIGDERALDVLLAPPAGKGSYVITKKGLTIMGAQFIALEMGVMVGKVVQVYLTEDYGTVVLYHEGQFMCTARCPERTGINRAEIATHAKKLQRQHIAAQRKTAKSTKVDPDALVSSYLQEKAEVAGKLVALPRAGVVHTTGALKAAGEAARVLDGVVGNAEIPADLQAIMEKRRVDVAVEVVAKVSVIPETMQLRFRKWLELEEVLKVGGVIENALLTQWYGTYQRTAEFASLYQRHQEAVLVGSKMSAVGAAVHQFKT